MGLPLPHKEGKARIVERYLLLTLSEQEKKKRQKNGLPKIIKCEYFWSLKLFLTISFIFFFIQNVNLFLSASSRKEGMAFVEGHFKKIILNIIIIIITIIFIILMLFLASVLNFAF